MARYAKIGSRIGSLRTWLPEVTTTLLCILIVGTVLKIVAATDDGNLFNSHVSSYHNFKYNLFQNKKFRDQIKYE